MRVCVYSLNGSKTPSREIPTVYSEERLGNGEVGRNVEFSPFYISIERNEKRVSKNEDGIMSHFHFAFFFF